MMEELRNMMKRIEEMLEDVARDDRPAESDTSDDSLRNLGIGAYFR